MFCSDIYKTIETSAEATFKDKKSKFIAFAFPVMDEESAKEHLKILKQTYYDANHHCSAWRFGLNDNSFRTDDDGEPSGTAGKPILGQIKSYELTNILIVVVRYFGGVKLGTSGLIKAYKTASAEVIENSLIIEKTVNNFYNISFTYNSMNDVMKIIKEESPEIISQQFNLDCFMQLSIRLAKSNNLISRLENVETVKTEFLYSR